MLSQRSCSREGWRASFPFLLQFLSLRLSRFFLVPYLCHDTSFLILVLPLVLTTSAETTQSGRVGVQASVGNHLLAVGTDGPNT